MSLEQQLNDAINAQNTLTQTVANKMPQIDSRLAQFDTRVQEFVNNWGINGYTVLEVGAGKPFANIQAAFDSLNGKTLKSDVKIKVADGIYTYTGLWLANQPFARRIRIEGNVANPQACVLKWVADANKVSHGIVVDNLRGLQLAGFKLQGEATQTNWTHRSLYLGNGSLVFCDDDSLLIEGGVQGISINERSQLNATGVRVNNCIEWAIGVNGGSIGYLARPIITGPGKAVLSTIPVHVNPDTPQIRPCGILAQDTATAWVGSANVSGVSTGLYSVRNAYLWCDLAQVRDVQTGCVAEFGGCLWSYYRAASANAPVQRSKVSNAVEGYVAQYQGMLEAPGAVAENCTTGFRASSGGWLYAGDGYVSACTNGYTADQLAYLAAWNTNAASNATTKYPSPTSGAFVNSNGIVFFS